jgi:hypothetical protein
LKEIVPMPGLSPGRTDVWALTVREARTSARLNHPNVVRVFDVLFTAGRPWIVMEYVPGRSLYGVVQEDGPVSTDVAARVGLAVLDGLVAVHQAGVLHRDVKPHNVLLADDGRILLADFGVAMFHGDLADDVILGSPGYVAPERVREGASTVQTDLWSLGATLYWMLEGKPPAGRLGSGRLAKVVNGLLHHDPAQRLSAEAARSMLAKVAKVDKLSRLPLRKTAVVTSAAALVATAGTVAWAEWSPTGAAEGATRPTALSCASAADPQPGTGKAASAGTPITGTPIDGGWVRAVDAGFSVGVPVGWRRATDGAAVCLIDPTGRRAVAVAAEASEDPDRVAYWQREENDLLHGAGPAGYQRVDISPALYQKGGADWEYRYEADGVRWHVLRRVVMQQAVDHLGQPPGRDPALGRLAFEHPVQRGAQRPEVGLYGRGALADPLRRDVARRSEDDVVGEVAVEHGHPEVGEQDAAVVGEQDVVRLDVAVQHAGAVHGLEPVEDGQPDAGRLVGADRPVLLHGRVQGPAGDVLHHDPRPAVGEQDVEDAHDVGMVQAGAGPGLADGLRPDVVVPGRYPGQRHDLFQGDVAGQDLVPGLPDGAHAAHADRADQEESARDDFPHDRHPRPPLSRQSFCPGTRGRVRSRSIESCFGAI